jgi:hypothetical protein
VRKALAEIKRLRHLDERLRSLECAVHVGVAADPGIHAWEFSAYSQGGEDGILLHLFTRIGASSFRFLEFGCGNGAECNSANLALGFGWGGLLLDADIVNIEKARRFFAAKLGPGTERVIIQREMVTPTNINPLISQALARSFELDLLSIDVDGNDYWIWEAVEGSVARVVVVEYNATFGPDRAVTVEFDEAFDRNAKHESGYYHGASLEALRRLGVARGYQLVGCDSGGVNAFFVRADCAGGLPSLSSHDAFVPLHERAGLALPDQFKVISHLPLIEV